MILPWGKYIFNYLPMGLNQAADGFNLTSDIIIANTERIEKSTDDILGMPKTFNEAYPQLAQVVTNCIKNGFVVSRKKFDIGTNITYGGFNLQKQDNKTIAIKADQARIDTILSMDPPTTKTQVQSFLWMIKVLHNWYPTMTKP